jgi:hypothetical protein
VSETDDTRAGACRTYVVAAILPDMTRPTALPPAARDGERRSSRQQRLGTRPALLWAGIAVLTVGAATVLAGCYRTAVEFSDGRLKPLVPIATNAPLAGEFLVLVGLVACVSGILTILASRRAH